MSATTTSSSNNGFKVNWMNMAAEGKVIWEQSLDNFDGQKEIAIKVPKSILKCKQVAREINFSSPSIVKKLRLLQTVFFNNQPIEEWKFDFGFVIPGSTNTWQSTIEAADETLPAEILSGNIVIDTQFLDDTTPIAQTKVRVYYV